MNEHNIFWSDETKDQCNTCYGEMHTGESWHRANNHYCPHIGDAPIALIIFAKNSHTDLHGVLSITPVFCFIVLQFCCMQQQQIWCQIAHKFTSSCGKGDVDKTNSHNKLQDKNNCIGYTFQKLRDMGKRFISTTVMGKVIIFIGDIEGNDIYC